MASIPGARSGDDVKSAACEVARKSCDVPKWSRSEKSHEGESCTVDVPEALRSQGFEAEHAPLRTARSCTDRYGMLQSRRTYGIARNCL